MMTFQDPNASRQVLRNVQIGDLLTQHHAIGFSIWSLIDRASMRPERDGKESLRWRLVRFLPFLVAITFRCISPPALQFNFAHAAPDHSSSTFVKAHPILNDERKDSNSCRVAAEMHDSLQLRFPRVSLFVFTQLWTDNMIHRLFSMRNLASTTRQIIQTIQYRGLYTRQMRFDLSIDFCNIWIIQQYYKW
jgi:hypothetical protein